MLTQKQIERRKRSIKNIIFLTVVLLGLIFLYAFLRQGEIRETATYKKNQQVAIQKGDTLQMGIVEKVYSSFFVGSTVKYKIRLSSSKTVKGIKEEELAPAIDSKYGFGQEVEVQDGSNTSYRIDQILKTGDEVSYGLISDSKETLTVSQDEIVYIYQVPLLESNTAQDNNAIIQEAFEISKEHQMTILNFPEGEFLIGSHQPDEEYIKLASNVELRANQTTLIVDGSARWYGFSTGSGIRDGVNNFTLTGFDIRAKDLINGNQFIMMFNHGYNINASNNTFTLVHQMSSHIFDLGGVELATFTNNKFIGYAPETASLTELGNYSLHNIYAEAIQTDYSDANESWDGGFLAAIDENYYVNNYYKFVSQDITITDNQLLPYRDENDKIVAYSATLGQHSSEVWNLKIINNTIEKPLVYNFPEVDTDRYWYFTPVHAETEGDSVLEPNTIIE